MVTKQQLTCTGTLITWQSRSEQHKGTRTGDKEKKRGLLLAYQKERWKLEQEMLQKVAWWSVKESRWRKDLMNILATTFYTSDSFFYFNTSCFNQYWQKYLEPIEKQCISPLGWKNDSVLSLVHALPMWKKTLAKEEETGDTWNLKGVAGTNSRKPGWIDSTSGFSNCFRM